MAEELLGKFRCVVLTPSAKLLDCKTHSITLPAHDGQMGVWRNHMPMLCRLGLGIMCVHNFITDKEQMPNNTCFLVDGGFARISNNVITVLAYDVTVPADIDEAKAAKMLEEANKLPDGSAEAMQRRLHDIRKATLLLQMTQTAAAGKDKQPVPS